MDTSLQGAPLNAAELQVQERHVPHKPGPGLFSVVLPTNTKRYKEQRLQVNFPPCKMSVKLQRKLVGGAPA